MKKKEYTEEKKGAKERFDRAMSTIFQAPKVVRVAQAAKASPSRKSGKSGKGS